MEQKVEYIVAKDESIKGSYNDLLDICTDVAKSLGQEYTCFRTIKKEVNAQKSQFVITSQALLEAVQNTSSRDRILLNTRLMIHLEDISQMLKEVPLHLRTILGKFKEAKRAKSRLGVRNSVEADGPDQEFRDVLENVKPSLDTFYSLANLLIGQPAMTEAPEEAERLYIEGLAAATLFQYLSQACPVDSHRSHTIYLGLSTDDTAVHETRMAIQSRATSQNRVWFRVQPTVDAIVPKETRPSTTVQVLETSTHKRKLPSGASMSPRPEPKARKTVHGRVANHEQGNSLAITNGSSVINQFQVCPEYLTQGEDSNLVVVRMVGVSKEWHNIYFLESDLRPPDGDAPIKLATLFSGKRREHYYNFSRRPHNFSWRVRVARLVAEVVLRIQHPWCPCYWSEKDVVFYALEAYNGDLIPFLKVEVERQNGASSDTMATGRPGRWLLNIALILLQLGLSQPIDATPNDMGEEEYRKHILRYVDKAKDKSLRKYLTVVRSCVEFDSGEDDRDNVDEHGFHKKYYQRIIFPLKGIENELGPSGYYGGCT